MLTYKDKVAIHNARNALERHMYCRILPESPIEKTLWLPKNYLDYIKHLAKHVVGMNCIRPVYHKRTAMEQHLQCTTCGLVEPMKEWAVKHANKKLDLG